MSQAEPLYIGSELYRRSTYGATHPLAIPRLSTCTDLCRAMGWLAEAQYRVAPMAERDAVTRFHAPDYVDALERAELTQNVTDEDRARFRIGAEGNPVYPEIFRRPMTSAGGVMLAARLTADGGIVHCPGGGTHHGRPARASGFCYLNDPVLGLISWLDQGLERIVYLDIDAHHGDGVQDAFHDDPRVLTISVHESGRWPFTGPVPEGFNDTEFAWLLDHAILKLIDAFRPEAIFVQCGADALLEDPLARLALSNNAHWSMIEQVMPRTPRLIVTGGGGYNPYTVGRCWAGVWATLNHLAIPDRTTPEAEAVLRALTYNRAAGRNPPAHWFTTLRDVPRPGPVRDEIKRLAEITMEPTL